MGGPSLFLASVPRSHWVLDDRREYPGQENPSVKIQCQTPLLSVLSGFAFHPIALYHASPMLRYCFLTFGSRRLM